MDVVAAVRHIKLAIRGRNRVPLAVHTELELWMSRVHHTILHLQSKKVRRCFCRRQKCLVLQGTTLHCLRASHPPTWTVHRRSWRRPQITKFDYNLQQNDEILNLKSQLFFFLLIPNPHCFNPIVTSSTWLKVFSIGSRMPLCWQYFRAFIKFIWKKKIFSLAPKYINFHFHSPLNPCSNEKLFPWHWSTGHLELKINDLRSELSISVYLSHLFLSPGISSFLIQKQTN